MNNDNTLTISSTLWCENCEQPTEHAIVNNDIICTQCHSVLTSQHGAHQ